MISVRAMSAAPMLGRVSTSGERPVLSWRTRCETMLMSTWGSLTITAAWSTSSLFIGVAGNLFAGLVCSNGMMFVGSICQCGVFG